MKRVVLVLFAVLIGNGLFAQKTIVDVAVGNSDFSTLVAAVKAADLVEALQGEGPFTVFAPTNSAFAKIDKASLNSLLEKKNKDLLTNVLTYHVVKGKISAADLVGALKVGGGETTLTMLNGSTLKVKLRDGKVWLIDGNNNFSEIILTDVDASNGFIHAIDAVIMPKAKKKSRHNHNSSCH